MNRKLLASAAALGLLAVIAGTFAAHLLKTKLTSDSLAIFDTGTRYHMYHALAALLSASLAEKLGRLANTAATCFILGVLIFSGSLYLLALTNLKWLGMITPIGGLAFLLGWILLLIAAIRPRTA